MASNDRKTTKTDSEPSNSTSENHPKLSENLNFSTLRLIEEWREGFEWARKHSVLPQLLLLIDCFRIKNQPTYLGSVLDHLASEDPLHQLEQWAENDSYCLFLLQLASAALVDPSIYRHYPPLPPEPPARKQFGRTTKKWFLLATLVQPPNPGEPNLVGWYRTIRTWLIREALQRTHQGNPVDSNIRFLANHLRLARETDRGWQELVDALATQSANFDSFRRMLIYHALAAKQQPWTDQVSPASRRSFVDRVIAIASGEEAPEAEEGHSTFDDLVSCHAPLVLRHRERLPALLALPDREDEEDDDGLSASFRYEGLEPEEDLYATQSDSDKSPLQHGLKSASVLTLVGEELHFLPWSWKMINPREQKALEQWIQVSLDRPTDSREALIAAMVWGAISTGRTLLRFLECPVSATDEYGDEWTLGRQSLCFARQRPARHSAWRPSTVDERSWVVSPTPFLTLPVPTQVKRVLAHALSSRPDARNIGQLWPDDTDCSAKSFFTRQMRGSLSRITSSMLASLLPMRSYRAMGNSVFTRLLTAHPKSALPAACAYSAWSAEEAESILQGRHPEDGRGLYAPEALIGMGSLLIAIEAYLKRDIQRATALSSEADLAGDFILTHNRYVAFLVAALLAATGGRVVRDPFESPGQFDFSDGLVFIDDKASGNLRQGRLLPLPRSLCRHLQEEYQPYLERLASALESTHPALSSDIGTLIQGQQDLPMPFFFFLAQAPHLHWISVSEASISALGLFETPLPLRLFRHRLPNRLRILGADSEVIEGLMGHAEAGASSYGDDSPRCWAHDMAKVRPLLEKCFSELNFKLRPPRTVQIGEMTPVPQAGVRQKTLFGSRAREQARKKRREGARKEARAQIEQFLAGRELADLDSEELQQLTAQLLGIDNGKLSSNGYLKYLYLEVRVDALWNRQTRWVRSRTRFTLAEAAETPFNELAVKAVQTRDRILNQLQDLIGRRALRTIPSGESRILSAALLCVRVGIGSIPILEAVLKLQDFRVIHLRGYYYLEYAPDMSDYLHKGMQISAVQRFQIPRELALLLDRASAAERVTPLLDKAIPSRMRILAESLSDTGLAITTACTARQLIQTLSQMMNQYTAMHRPGQVAALLSGRRISVSLGWHDRIRRDEDRIPEVHKPAVSEKPNEDDEQESYDSGLGRSITAIRSPSTLESESLLTSARDFCAQLRKALHIDGQIPRKASPVERKRIRAAIRNVLNTHSGKVSGGIYLLGQWMLHLTFQQKNRKELLSLASVNRYFGALSPTFQGLMHEQDLLSADEDTLTALYEDLLLSCSGLKNRKLIEYCLLSFHSWARNSGIGEPLWQELPLSGVYWSISASFVTEMEYLDTLGMLLSDKSEAHDGLGLQAAFLLLLCYRFALRPGEALGLVRSDWIRQDDDVVVLVRKNYLRSLKRPQSRRQVPLVFPLFPREVEIIKKMEGITEAAHGNDSRAPLFAEADTPRAVDRDRELKRRITEALRLVTGNSNLVIYSARHSCGMEVATALLGLEPGGLANRRRTAQARRMQNIRTILLGRDETATRRAAWALARFMGHAGPDRAPRSYIHLYTEWADHFHDWPKADFESPWKTIVNLDALPRKKRIVPLFSETKPRFQPLTPVIALKLMRLVVRGNSLQRASEYLSLEWASLQTLAETIHKVGDKLVLARLKDRPWQNDGHEYLRRLSDDAWRRLIHLALEAEKNSREIEPLVTLEEIPQLVGANRQLLLWEERHFQWARQMLDAHALPREQYVVIPGGGSPVIRELIRTTAANHGFEPDPPTSERIIKKEQPSKPAETSSEAAQTSRKKETIIKVIRRPRLDTAQEMVRGRPRAIPERWGIAWKESSETSIRSGIEWMVLVVASAVGLARNR